LYYEPIGYFATESYRNWLPGGQVSRPVGIMVSPPNPDWEKKIAGASRVWLVTYPAKLRNPNIDAVSAELQKHFPLVNQQRFRAVTVTEYRLER
jgi:hypothetical protein